MRSLAGLVLAAAIAAALASAAGGAVAPKGGAPGTYRAAGVRFVLVAGGRIRTFEVRGMGHCNKGIGAVPYDFGSKAGSAGVIIVSKSRILFTSSLQQNFTSKQGVRAAGTSTLSITGHFPARSKRLVGHWSVLLTGTANGKPGLRCTAGSSFVARR